MLRNASLTAMMTGVLLTTTATVAVAGVKTTSTSTAPDLQPGSYKKYLVLARIKDESVKRILEDTVVAKLKAAKTDAVAAYTVLVPEDLASSEAIHAKAEQLGVDAGLVFTVIADETQQKANPTVSAGVGVPVRVGPFSVFLGTSVPIGGGGTSTVRTVQLKSELVAREGTNPRWTATYTTDLKGGAEGTAEDLAKQAIKQLKKAHVLK